jgi:fructokinase
MAHRPMLGAVEGGGTKFVCAVGRGVDAIVAEATVRVTSPDETLGRVLEFFARAPAVDAFGIASFGPLELDAGSPDFGRLLPTPKRGWSGADLLGAFRERFRGPVAIDTDVNGAALAELEAAAGAVHSLAYVTVGTGVGGGLVVDGRAVHGLLHPEMGHVPVRRAADDHDFVGVCPFHGDCVEGLASGPAVVRRWGAPLAALPDGHAAFDRLGDYLGQLCATIALVTSAQRIVFGGGVMSDGRLLPFVRRAAHARLAGYLRPERLGTLDEYVVAPTLGSRAGLAGAFLLAARVAH